MWLRPSTGSPILPMVRTRCRPSPAICRRAAPARSTTTPSSSTSMPPTATSPMPCRPTTTMPIILPADYAGDFEQSMIGTGPFKLEKYTPKVGASFVATRNTGAARSRRNASRSRSMTISSRRSWRCRAARSTSSSRCRCCRASALLNDPNFDDHQHCPRRRISRSTCATTWSRSRTSGCGGRLRSASTGQSWCRA